MTARCLSSGLFSSITTTIPCLADIALSCPPPSAHHEPRQGQARTGDGNTPAVDHSYKHCGKLDIHGSSHQLITLQQYHQLLGADPIIIDNQPGLLGQGHHRSSQRCAVVIVVVIKLFPKSTGLASRSKTTSYVSFPCSVHTHFLSPK